MLTPSDIVILILLVVSGVFIWIARKSSSNQRTDASHSHDHEARPSTEQNEVHGKTNEHAGYGEGKKKDAPCNFK